MMGGYLESVCCNSTLRVLRCYPGTWVCSCFELACLPRGWSCCSFWRFGGGVLLDSAFFFLSEMCNVKGGKGDPGVYEEYWW